MYTCCLTYSDTLTNNESQFLHLRITKTVIEVTMFEISKDNILLILSDNETTVAVGTGGVHRIELDLGGELSCTMIETELDKLYFSPLFGDDIMNTLWRWAEGQLIKLPCIHSVPEFLWKY